MQEFHFHIVIDLLLLKNSQIIITFLTNLTLKSELQEWLHLFIEQICPVYCCNQQLQQTRSHPVIYRCPKSTAIEFALKTFDCLVKLPPGEMGRRHAGLQQQEPKCGHKIELCCLTNSLGLSLPKL